MLLVQAKISEPLLYGYHPFFIVGGSLLLKLGLYFNEGTFPWLEQYWVYVLSFAVLLEVLLLWVLSSDGRWWIRAKADGPYFEGARRKEQMRSPMQQPPPLPISLQNDCPNFFCIEL